VEASRKKAPGIDQTTANQERESREILQPPWQRSDLPPADRPDLGPPALALLHHRRGAVACDDNGVALFNRVRYRHDDESIFLYAFDLIELNGDDLRPDPLERRKATRARPGQSSGSGKIVQLALRMFRQSQRARS
jgi:hypothetical protein